MSGTATQEGRSAVEAITRTTGPQTTDGRRWEVQLSGIPPDEWLELFKTSGDLSASALPRRVSFDRSSAAFKSTEDQVEHWIASIDRWIASANVRYLTNLEQARQERFDRVDAQLKETERIQRMNERFKGL